MITCHHLEELHEPGAPLHLALGVFDGVHIGHQEVIRRAVDAARRHGGLAGVLTFDPHPIRVIAPARAPAALLATLDHKARIVRDLGASLFIPLHFDEAFAAIEAGQFLAALTAAPVRTIAVGEDWRFGRDRRGDVAFLSNAAIAHGFQLEAVPPIMLDGDRVSSTRIRQAIRDGNLADAHRMLGRPHSISGVVLHGRQLGRQLGFPTANLATGEVQTPPDGVWTVKITLPGGHTHPGIANLGVRPTVDGSKRLLEVHLFDFHADLYGREIEVEFLRFIRGEKKFDTLDDLRAQISADIAQARLDS